MSILLLVAFNYYIASVRTFLEKRRCSKLKFHRGDENHKYIYIYIKTSKRHLKDILND